MSKKFYRELKEFVFLTLVALLISFGVRAAVAESYLIPTPSMVPAIKVGDRILANKLVYRFRMPERGEVVIFNPPKGVGDQPFVKRVIGLPGDIVEVQNGNIYINGSVFEVKTATATTYSYGPMNVPPGYLFVLGDNRNTSFDSHCWGFLPLKNVIGEGVLIFWPPEDIKLLGN